MRETITVHKLNAHGEEVWRYQGFVLQRTESSVTLEAFFDRGEVEFFGIHLRRGDRFVETFYNDRWYNIFTIFDVLDGQLKGWYCNITRPARIEDSHIYADDLALDLVVKPEGQYHVLDQDEFEALDLPPEDQQHALKALEELETWALKRTGPFQRLEGGEAHSGE